MIALPILRRAAVALPALLVALWLAFDAARERDDQLHSEALLTARFLVAAVDRELSAIETSLQVLAESQALAKNDLAAYYQEAKVAARAQIVNNVVLSDREGRQLLNTLKPWGTPLPVGSLPGLRTLFTSRQTVVTDLFVGPVTGTPLVAMGVPVQRDGEVAYSLSVGISPDRLSGVLKQLGLPEGWMATIVDSKGRVVARTRELQRFVGQPAAQGLRDQMQRQREGVGDVETLEGIAVVGAYSPSRASGWTIAVGAPSAHLRREALLQAAIVLAALVATGLVAWRMTHARS